MASINREFGAVHGHGLQAFGLDTSNLLFAQTKKNHETLWALEDGARSGCLKAVVGEVSNLSFTESRRLLLASAATNTPVLLLRSHNNLGTSAAATRWRVRASIGAGALLEPTTSHFASWHVELQRCRGGRLGQWNLEWDHETYRFRLAQNISARLSEATDLPESSQSYRAASA